MASEHTEHVHGHNLADNHDFAAANQKHFDAEAKAFDAKPNAIELARRLAKAMIETYPALFNEESTTVDQYNLRVTNQGIPPEEMRAIRAKLKGEDSELEGPSYHHIQDIDAITRILTTHLCPAGSLLIADILKNELSKGRELLDDFRHVVPHRSGFTEETMLAHFQQAGLKDFAFTKATRAQVHGEDVDFFLARGWSA
ncbi:hypothetical protein EIP86_005873 [Pleurotus ostreatoroseus]|nr:hypothetical protein EIP86_005873 [Pleurotus ostreatoroseus]